MLPMQIYSANFASNLAETVITFNGTFLSYSKLDDIAFPLSVLQFLA